MNLEMATISAICSSQPSLTIWSPNCVQACLIGINTYSLNEHLVLCKIGVMEVSHSATSLRALFGVARKAHVGRVVREMGAMSDTLKAYAPGRAYPGPKGMFHVPMPTHPHG